MAFPSQRRAALVAFGFGLGFGLGGCVHTPSPAANSDFDVYFLPARGDSILIDAGDTEIVIDGGLRARPLEPLLRKTVDDGIIELLIVTHVDFDHWKGLEDGALGDLHVAEVWDPGWAPSPTRFLHTDGYEQLLEGFARRGTRTWRPLLDGPRTDVPLTLGSVTVEFLHPHGPPSTKRTGRPKKISGPNAYLNNNTSIVVRVEVGGHSFLFTGDINGDPNKNTRQYDAAEVEGTLIASNADLRADVLKIAHHGSPTSSTVEFIEAVSPQYAVAPYRFGITRREVLNRYRDVLCPDVPGNRCDRVLTTRGQTVRCSGRGDYFDCEAVD